MLKLLRLAGFPVFVSIVFLNAFVDLGHKITIQNTVFKAYDGPGQIMLTAIVNGLILLPFVVLFVPAGRCADRYAKPAVMRVSAWAAVALTLAITGCYYAGLFWPAFAMTFLLAAQSAIYSPAKLGYIRELVGLDHLAAANSAVQVATTSAVLIGTFAFSILFETFLGRAPAADTSGILRSIAASGWFLVAGAVVELILAYRLPTVPPGAPDLAAAPEPGSARADLARVRRHPVIWLAVVGLAIFWSIAQVVLACFPAFAKAAHGIDNTVVIQGLLAASGVGLLLGAGVVARLSRNHIETGLVPIGAVGVALAVIALPLMSNPLLLAAAFVAFGALGALFVIPVNALVQYHAGDADRGRILAGSNLVQNLVMLTFLAATTALAAVGVPQLGLFIMLGGVAVGGALYTIYRLPYSLTRFIVGRLFAAKYRIDVVGFDKLPTAGGVLLLGNHISWIDWAMIQIASPRPVRFVMHRAIYSRWYARWILDLVGAIPISPGEYSEALSRVTELLDAGEVVCLFPEGAISKTGQLCEFKHGYEKAAQAASGVIVPFYLRGLWGSSFSRSNEGLRLRRRSARRREVIVAFGDALPMTTTAEILKQRVFELSISAWHHHAESLGTIGQAWLETARRMPARTAVTDSAGPVLSHARLAVGATLLARGIGRRTKAANVAILLPASAAGLMANLAVLMRGKTVVNLNYTAAPEAIEAALAEADIDLVVTAKRFVDKLRGRGFDLERCLSSREVLLLEDFRDRTTTAAKLATLAAFHLLPGRLYRALFLRRQDPAATAAILFSSGSEGTPKGVMLSHRNILANVRQVSDVLNTEQDDVALGSLPLFHAFGLTVTALMPLLEGIPLVTHPDPTDAVNIGKAVARHRVTLLCGTATFLRLYTRNKRLVPQMFESLRVVVAGAEKVSNDVRSGFFDKFGLPVMEGYGTTETTPVASVNIPDELDVRSWRLQHGARTGTVGMPLPGTSFRIVDPETLAELPAGSDGLILIGGVQVMRGYLGDPARTAEAIVELDGLRWYRTGDKGRIDSDGFLTIVDRYSRFAKVGGEMVSLGAVEETVRTVAQDPELEVCAIAVPDPRKGERVILLVANQAGPPATDALRQRLLEAGTNALLVPAEFVAVAAIPKLGSGKTDFRAAALLLPAAAA